MLSTKTCKKYPLLTYFSLVFVISWGVIYILAGPDGFPVTEEQAMTLGMAILLGPGIAGILLTGLFSGLAGYRSLLSRLVKWRVNVKWYAVALLTAPVLTAAVIAVLSLFSHKFHPAVFLSEEKLNLLLFAPIGGLIVAVFEELGWTGFAVPKLLQRHPVFNTGVIIGLVWGAWHFPLFWEVNSFTSLLPFLLLLAKLFSWLPPYRVLMVWVYKHTESLLIVILMHTSLVATLLVLDPIVKGTGLLLFILSRAVLLWAMAAVVSLGKNRAA